PRKMRDLLIFERRLFLNVLHQAAQAGAENNPRMRRARPGFLNERSRGLDFVVETVHGNKSQRSEARRQRLEDCPCHSNIRTSALPDRPAPAQNTTPPPALPPSARETAGK